MKNATPQLPEFDLSKPKTLMLDLDNPKPKEIVAIVEAIEADIKKNPKLGPLPVKTGWNEIDPAKGLNLLRRNRPGANRKIDPQTIVYYAKQMKAGEWKATGQPALFDSEGRLVDSQHRLLAGVISGVTWKTYVVTDIEAIPHLFAYIDNSRSRTAATALQTAGFNGTSSVIAKVLKLAEEVRLGVYNPSGIERLPRQTPAEMLALAERYPNAQPAARATATDWAPVVDYLGRNRKEVVAYLGMRISDQHSADVADDFFEEIGDLAPERKSDDPIGAFHKLIEKDQKNPSLKRQHVLGALIKVFNAWITNKELERRWMIQVNEDFPDLESAVEKEDA